MRPARGDQTDGGRRVRGDEQEKISEESKANRTVAEER
jgi:hypothetical protein